ncbi:hypothetical protein [Streptomyces luteogriseus]|uniref:hypothetical protein n=1 Tax=Streptomyces luteogriseus TaxID=68233 RepID=UPI00378AA1E0
MERAGRRGIPGGGVRVGLLMACAAVPPWAALALGAALVEFLRPGGDTRLADRDPRHGGTLTGRSLLAGGLAGLILAGGLALASRGVTRPSGPALAGAPLGALAFPAVSAVVAIGTDTAGRTRRRPWSRPPGPAQGRGPAPVTAGAAPERPYRAS